MIACIIQRAEQIIECVHVCLWPNKLNSYLITGSSARAKDVLLEEDQSIKTLVYLAS